MKIMILMPVYKRPDILKTVIFYLKRLKTKHELFIVPILSREDKYFTENLRTVLDFHYITHPNQPLGTKKNAGMRYALRFKWDYFMDLGSDNIINPSLFDVYELYLKERFRFFGLLNLFMYDIDQGKGLFIKNYNDGMCFGAGRMLRRDVIEQVGDLWPEEHDVGMDTMSRKKIVKFCDETPIETGEEPLILDLKSEQNLNPFWSIEQLFKGKIKYVSKEFIEENFMEIPHDYIQLETKDGVIGEYWKRRKEIKDIPNYKIYESVERDRSLWFGSRKYASYKQFQQARDK